MSDRMLITATLLNGFRWYTEFYGRERDEETIQREDFLRLLKREPMETPGLAILEGRRLEDDVVEYCLAGGYEGARKDIRQIGNKCMGFLYQQSVDRVLDNYLVYGRVDFMKGDTIRDVKWSPAWHIGKFVRSAQHRIYLYCTGLPRFVYDISDGNNAYEEEYRNGPQIEGELRGQIDDFISYLRDDPEAKELFHTHWKALS